MPQKRRRRCEFGSKNQSDVAKTTSVNVSSIRSCKKHRMDSSLEIPKRVEPSDTLISAQGN